MLQLEESEIESNQMKVIFISPCKDDKYNCKYTGLICKNLKIEHKRHFKLNF